MNREMRPDTSDALRLEGLAGGYRQLTVFRNVTHTIGHNHTVGILGPNGGGKTTLLMTIAGALPEHSGCVLFDGRNITSLPSYRRARAGLVLVPQGRHIFSQLSVHDNLELTRAVEGTRRDLGPFEQRLAEIFTLFPGLKDRSDQPGGALSGGEQQMLAIARALLLKPKVLMLDEPTQGLAPIIINNLANALRTLKSRLTIIVVEQNKSFLDGLADSILHMRAGSLTTS
jgi:ABC-type branched-subunit amino acid transport system ATPase component